MSFQALNWALTQPNVTPGQKLVLLILANYADENDTCFPGQERLARESNQSVRAVRSQLKDLEDVGLITRLPRFRIDGGRTSDLYRLNLAGPPPANPAGGGPRNHLPGAPEPVAGEPPKEPPQDPAPEGDRDIPRGADDQLPLSLPSVESDHLPARVKTKVVGDDDETFERFWREYPRRAAKQHARRAWSKALKGGAAPEDLIRGAGLYARQRADEDPAFTRYPATWLNGGCWADEDTPRATTKGGHRPFQDDPDDWEYDDANPYPTAMFATNTDD